MLRILPSAKIVAFAAIVGALASASIVLVRDAPLDSLQALTTSAVLSPLVLAAWRGLVLVFILAVLAWLALDRQGTPALGNSALDRFLFPPLIAPQHSESPCQSSCWGTSDSLHLLFGASLCRVCSVCIYFHSMNEPNHLLAIYFASTLFLQYAQASFPEIFSGNQILSHFPNLVYILYEISFAVSLLITSCVTYVLIPASVAAGLKYESFYTTAALVFPDSLFIGRSCIMSMFSQ